MRARERTFMSFTLLTFHLSRGWLNALALLNMNCHHRTRIEKVGEGGEARASRDGERVGARERTFMFVILPTSQSLMSWLKSLHP